MHARRAASLLRTRHDLTTPQGVEPVIDGRRYLAFCSNDYLGLANHPKLVEAFRKGVAIHGVGSGASHLITGHNAVHGSLEEALAEFTGRQRALLFSTGYMANLGVVSSFAGRGDVVFADRLNHASLVDAAILSRARVRRYLHTKIAGLSSALDKSNPPAKLIITDGVFSMDGDLAPIPKLAQEARRHGAALVVDDAHGIGVLGQGGRGTLEHFQAGSDDVPVLVGTLGKALGTFGAFVAGSVAVVETLVQRARSYIYTTALPPVIAAATLESIRLVREESWRRERLQALIARFRSGAAELGLPLTTSTSPIQPVVFGDTDHALLVSARLRERGVFIPAIRPPTVPKDSARLRVTFSAAHELCHVDRLVDELSMAVG